MRLRAVVEFTPDRDCYPSGSTAAEIAAIELAAIERWARGVGGVVRANVDVIGPVAEDELSVCDADEPTDLVHGFGCGVRP